MLLVLCSLLTLLGGGFAALLSGRGEHACRIGTLAAATGSGLGLVPALQALFQPHAPLVFSFTLLPLGEGALRLDALSAAFCIPVLLLSGICAIYGGSAVAPLAGKRHLGLHWFFYNLLAAGMLLVFVAADAFTFLLAWELMSLAPFFLISINDDEARVRAASWIYLVAAHLGALFLLGFFSLLSAKSGGGLSFQSFMAQGGKEGAGLLFLLALAGFGTKAGIMPLHVWLPEAHPAAPSHVSALMSGAMIKTGVYGLLRTLSFLGAGEAWWAHLLMGLGAFSGVVGILFALAQRDIKRSLAYSSVENMGIICLGLGMGLFCRQQGHTALALLALTGAMLHLVNHSLLKGMLFLCAGNVLHGAGSLSLSALGGLQKRMPLTAACFALGSAAIAALPPFNGFAGEFLLYIAMASGGSLPAQGLNLVFWCGLFMLALVGGFTLLCFARLFSLAFLGEARSGLVRDAHDPCRLQLGSILALAALCLVSALAAPWTAAALSAALSPHLHGGAVPIPVLAAAPALTPPAAWSLSHAAPALQSAFELLQSVNQGFLMLLLFFLALFLLRRRLLRGREIAASPTWDCGYIAPTARMQYSGGSFSQPASFFMRSILRSREQLPLLREFFPMAATATYSAPDWMANGLFAPMFRAVTVLARWCKKLQHGRVNAYILYILLTLMALLAWKLG